MKIKKYIEKRPWGKFEEYVRNKKCTVKVLTLTEGEELSLQYHKEREEFWRIVEGEGEITIGEEKHEAGTGDEFHIPLKSPHRAKAKKGELKILEISFGEADEEDIVRLEDKYKRKQRRNSEQNG